MRRKPTARPGARSTRIAMSLIGLGLGLGLGLAAGIGVSRAQTEPGASAPVEADPPSLRLWVVDDSTKVLPTMALGAPRAHGTGERQEPVTLSGAGGETVAFQLVVEGSRPTARMTVTVAELTNEGGDHAIPTDAIAVFLETYIDRRAGATGPSTGGPGRYPDPLVPLWANGPASREVAHPIDLPRDQKRVLWVDVAVPRRQPAGRYRGSLTLRLDGEASVHVAIELERYGFDLPARPTLDTWVPLYAAPFIDLENVLMLDTRRSVELAQRYFRMAHEHRFVTQGIEYEPRLIWDEKTGELLDADWSSYDLYHASALDGTLFADGEPPAVWKVGGFRWWGGLPGLSPYFGGKLEDGSLNSAHRRALSEYASEIRRHFDAMGWRRSELFMYMVEEPDLEAFPGLGEFIAATGRSIRASKAGILHLVTMPPSDGSPTLGAIDIWATSFADYSPVEMTSRQSLGERAWLFQGEESRVRGQALNDGGLGLRSWGWLAWRYGVDGVFLWSGNNWSRDPYRDADAMSSNDGRLGHGVLFYPGAMLPTIGFPPVHGPVSSVRMKLLRRGLLDHDYFALLDSLGGDPDPIVERIVHDSRGWDVTSEPKEDGSPSVATATGATRVDYGAWNRDPSAWDTARDIIAREIERRLEGRAVSISRDRD